MNPIKNGKQVFAVLSMATVMSISMSVKVNAASEIDAAAHTAANAVVQSENKNTSSSNTNVKTNSDASSEKREEVSAIDSKEASVGDKSTVVESANSLEMSDKNVGGPVGVEEPEGEIISTETANPENGTATEKKLADATLNNLNSDENKGAEDKAAGVTSEAKAAEKTQAADENLNLSEGKVTEPQKAPEKVTEPNYSEEEKNIKNYNDSERYKTTDLTPGSTIVENFKTDEGVEKDGFKFDTLNPSKTSPSKTEFGYEIVIDKKTGQRTYTKIAVTDSGRISAKAGDKPFLGEGEKLTPESPTVTYKPGEDGYTKKGRQADYNYDASEETLKHINSKDNDTTVIGMKDNYTEDNPQKKFFEGSSFAITYKVNPWPNENDKLQLMKLNGEYNEKVFVKGQDINTGVKVDNIDANAKDRLVGQVYNPITGAVVPGARAYIGDDGSIHIQMPEGALKKNADGKYVVNEESIFNTKDYKGIQNLDVKFFARPRTLEEFKAIAETPDESGETGTYVETGAGSDIINHKGEGVKIDKQGIDRYDHYNLIGKLKINLDDTRYYDQDFKDYEGNKLDEHTSTRVFPGEDFSVEIKEPAETGGTKKTGAEMDGAYSRGEASGKLKGEFLDIANKQIADDLGVDYKEFITSDDYADKRWTVVGKSDNISKFTIRAPKQAKAGDFLALPVEYTYTNGSTDTHWFHFVVQETNNNRPEYLAEVGPQGNTLVNKPIITKSEEDLKKNQPESYELIGNTFKDNKGNVWNVSIDQTTGAVTATLPAKLPDGKEINGGEKLTVPVKVKYTDQTTGEEKTEEIKAQFIATKQHKTLTNETTTSPIPFETEVEYDESLPEGYFKETQAGQKGELKITFVQDTLNGKKGIFQQDGTFKEGESKIVVETVKEPTKRIIKIGTKPASTKVEIPFDTEYEVDNNLEAGKTELVNDGEKGEVTITTTRNEDGTITVNKNVTKEAKNKKIKIGTKTQGQIVDTDKIPFGYKVEFDPDFYKNYPDATENYKIVTPGKEGENTKTWTIVNSEKVGDPKIDKTEPVDAVIKVGQKDYTGTVTNTVTKEVPYKVIIKENPELEAGKSNVKQKGVAGSKTFEYSGEIFNGELKEGTQFTEKEVADKYVAPQDEIIEIGTKPANNEKTYEREVGVEVEYVYDNTKPKGYRNIEALVPGKVITKVVNKYNPETGEIETTEEIEVIPGKRKVTFGTKDFTGEYEEVVKNINPYKTEIVFDNTLKAGEKVIDQPGENGETVTKTKKHLVNGVVEGSDDPVTEETKKVQNQVIRVGTMTDGKHSYTEKLPFKTTVEKVSDLKKGEWRYKLVNGEEQKGKVGSRKTEWTIKNSVVTDTNVVSEEKPVDAIIEIGDEDFTGNVSHEVTEEIPYDVKIVEDPTMIAGTSEVVTEGKTGSKTTKYTQGIKNGEADGELKSEVTAQKNPTHQVIKVGTKPAENNKDYDKEVNVKVEYVYDENLDKGVVKVGELTKGKVEIKTVNKYDPKTGEVTTTEVEEVKEATQKIIVGTKDFTGTYKYEKTCPLPFEVVIKEDPTLAKGEKVVDQEGQAGSKTTYYEQDIKNGQPDGDPKQLNEKINSQPKNHIVRIGTKVAKSSTVKTVDREIPFETKYIYDDTMDAGSEKVESEGKVGKEKVTITTKITDGTGETSEETNTITEKEDRIVRVGVKPVVVKEENIPQDTEYKHNSNLKAGETKKISEGTPGTVTITTFFNKETGKLETKVTRTESTPAKYEYGSKTEGKVTVETDIPYEVEFVADDTMAAGETKVTQKGELGKKETTITIENSKEVGSRTEKVTKKPVKKIVKYGTLCKLPTPGGDNTNPGGGNDDPSSPTDSSNSSNPGGNDSGTPGTTTDKPVTPGTPGETPNKPVDPNKPVEPGKLTEEKTPEGKTPEDKRFEGEKKISDSEKSEEVNKTEKAEKSQDEKELVKEEKAQEEKFVANKVLNRQVKDDDKAPKTGDAGLVTETSSAGLASGLLLLLGRRKRRKEENKKNK